MNKITDIILGEVHHSIDSSEFKEWARENWTEGKLKKEKDLLRLIKSYDNRHNVLFFLGKSKDIPQILKEFSTCELFYKKGKIYFTNLDGTTNGDDCNRFEDLPKKNQIQLLDYINSLL